MSRLTRAVAGAAVALVACGIAVTTADAGGLTSLVWGQLVAVPASTTDAGASWTASAASQGFPFGWQISCEASTCLAVDQGFTFSVITTTTDNGSTFSQMQQLQTSINALACTPSRSLCIAAGGNGTVPALLTLRRLGASAPPASVLSTVGGSLATPAMLLGASLGSLVNAIITVALILLITFPSQLFNRTYDVTCAFADGGSTACDGLRGCAGPTHI